MLLKGAAGQVGPLLCGVPDIFSVVLLFGVSLSSIFCDEPQGRAPPPKHRPAAGGRQTKRTHLPRVEGLRVFCSITYDQNFPVSCRLQGGHFQRGAESLLEPCSLVHPSSCFEQRGVVPSAQNQARCHAKT